MNKASYAHQDNNTGCMTWRKRYDYPDGSYRYTYLTRFSGYLHAVHAALLTGQYKHLGVNALCSVPKHPTRAVHFVIAFGPRISVNGKPIRLDTDGEPG